MWRGVASVGRSRLPRLGIDRDGDGGVQRLVRTQIAETPSRFGQEGGKGKRVQRPIGTQEQALSAFERSLSRGEQLLVELVSQHACLLVSVVQAAHIHCATESAHLSLQRLTSQGQKERLDGGRGDGEQEGLVFVDQEGQEEGAFLQGLLGFLEVQRLRIVQLGIAGRGLAQGGGEVLLAAFEGVEIPMEGFDLFLMFGGSVQFGELGVGVSALGIKSLLLLYQLGKPASAAKLRRRSARSSRRLRARKRSRVVKVCSWL